MLSNNSTESQASPLVDPKAVAAAAVPPLNPGSPIEVASQGSGTVNDPAASDTKPPGACDSEYLDFLA
ncbi:MAG TPA: hypothetical protein VIA62_00520 [Thermoanaerobaculia bacterium]|jgi:hypothetical protein|nr:hypothetical protein [Thermoanaerobaculia bacterium]